MLDLTLGPSFKIKQWFTGFGELSFRWIQICIGLRCVGLVIPYPVMGVGRLLFPHLLKAGCQYVWNIRFEILFELKLYKFL